MNVGSTPSNGSPSAVDKAQEFRERLGPKLEAAQAQLKDTNDRVKDFVRKNPAMTLFAAASIGFVIGRLASRR